MIRTIVCLAILSCWTFLLAQEPQTSVLNGTQTQPAARPDSTTPPTPEGWHFALSPYLWFSAIHGTVGVGSHDASVHAGFGDIFSNLNLGLMAASEVRHKRLLLLTDLMWIKLSDDKALPETQGGEITAKAKLQNFMFGPEVGTDLSKNHALTSMPSRDFAFGTWDRILNLSRTHWVRNFPRVRIGWTLCLGPGYRRR